MKGQRRTRLVLAVIGISLAVMVLSMTSLAGSPPVKAVLLASGVIVISSVLILLQLSLYREGDRKRASSPDEPLSVGEGSVPRNLKNPRLRTIWRNMEETRSLMRRKQEKACEEERKKEKKLLGLTEEEEILFLWDRSWLYSWPVALVSLFFVTASAVLSHVPSLIFLVIGLLGFLSLTTLNRLTRYYMTNFRVLVRRRSIFGMKSRWSALHYGDIRRCSESRAFFLAGLRLVGERETVEIKGLNRLQFETVSEILQEKIYKTAH